MVPLPPPVHAVSSTHVFTSSRRHRLYQHYAYRPSSAVFGAKLASKSSQGTVEFELVPHGATLHPFRYALATFLASCSGISRLLTSFFGLIPENSLLDKCPYYRTASEESTPNLPSSLKWVAEVERSAFGRKAGAVEDKIDSSLVGYRKRYRRDSFTLPAMVVIYNTALVWMMFTIEVRASSL